MTAIIWRLARAGIATAVLVALGGWALGMARFGRSDQAALARVEAELRQRFNASTDTLGTIAARIATTRDVIRRAGRDQAAARSLFDVIGAAVSSTVPAEETPRTGVSVYDQEGAPLAWLGRVTEMPRERLRGSEALFVAPGALGPELVRIEPILESTQSPTARLGTIVVQQLLGDAQGAPGFVDAFILSTSLVPVSLKPAYTAEGAGPFAFVIPTRSGAPLIEAEVAPGDLVAARTKWRDGTWAGVLAVLAITLLLCTGPLAEHRGRTHRPAVYIVTTLTLAAAVLAARAVFRVAADWLIGPQPFGTPLDLLLTALTLVALVWLALDTIERRRITRPRPRLVVLESPGDLLRIGAFFAVAGLIDVGILAAYETVLARIVSSTNLDVLHFSLHPISPQRLAVAFALVLLHAGVVWAAALVIRLGGTLWRTPRGWETRVAAAGAWLAGAAAGMEIVESTAPAIPLAPLFIALASAGLCASLLAHLRPRERHLSQAARLGVFFVALLLPALAMYPSLLAYAIAAKEQLVADEFGPQAASLRDDLKIRLQHALEQIDAMPSLADFVTVSDVSAPTPDSTRAFVVWSQTDLKVHRLTSAVELYGAKGELVSRFANLPEYATTSDHATSCDWDLFDEVAPFGSSQRNVLRASRGICQNGRVLGSIVVRVMLDYQALPFIASQSPYLESLQSDQPPVPEGYPGRDVEFVVYGWSGAPLFESGTSVWPLSDVLPRMIASREPFWANLSRDGVGYRVYFLNDRGGIYALGYPVITPFGHLINLAELVTLAFVLFVTLIGAATLFSALTSRTPASGRALWHEVRSSFYRKLFGAFLAAAVVPVGILAIATRTYFATQFAAGIEEAAARTARVAQRLVEDYVTLQQRGSGALEAIDDQIMVLVGRAIDQDVNLFAGDVPSASAQNRARLQASSERDLFASKLLSTRAPGDVYRAIVLDRLPTFVGIQRIGDYMLAAAPVRAGSREGIVTVPLPLRNQEIERQIDELDRRVLLGAVLFCLFGSALGYWMAERIADPVNRLSRATRRIARGDLDARIAATSSDELRRLVEDFNRMAADLKRQRAELERTQRLEAWADMARQVAHDIKNPLTPIQLSAEHVRRVNLDRGRPLSPVLDECVNAILTQVKLLRQISAEFSSFASSPTPRPEPTRLADIIDEVVEPYRTGLAGRVAIDVRVPDGLPHVSIDRTLFARALTNVVENALHAMPGGGTLTISAAEAPSAVLPAEPSTNPWIAVRITDTGVGMDADALSKIFEPYFSTKATGTGLGLTIAKRNVELNGGTIQIESQRGLGTTVTITLPV